MSTPTFAPTSTPDARPLQWVFPSPDPVIRPGQLHGPLDAKRASAPHVLDLGDRYRLYYWATGSAGNTILMAEAPIDRPNDWKPLGGPLLLPQPGTPHNHGGPSFPYVLQLTDKHWLMYFCGWGLPQPGTPLKNTTGLALSDDAGLTWRYHDTNPILPLDQPYDHSATGSVAVVPHQNRFRMYYTAIGDWGPKPPHVRTGHGDVIPTIGIALAESDDAIHWRKPLSNLLISPREFAVTPYEYIRSKPFLLREPNQWRLFVSTFGHAYRVRSLVSTDGLDWTDVPSNPDGDLGVGQPGRFDDHQRCYAAAVIHQHTRRLWYAANGFGATGIGYAESTPINM